LGRPKPQSEWNGFPPDRRTIVNMPEPLTRDGILEALREMPAEATIDDAIERLMFLARIEAGLSELDAGEGVPHDEVKRRLGM
jgi:hypothetical protein